MALAVWATAGSGRGYILTYAPGAKKQDVANFVAQKVEGRIL
jgi:hypothetical protein